MSSKKNKIYKREDLAEVLEKKRNDGKKIGVTNGVFDILHAGHVDYLEKAKELCDILIVSINTDASVKEYKDAGRPINSAEDRAAVLAALESVDFVTFHNERRMRNTLETLKPDFYIKAGDYSLDELTSKDVLDQWGGEARLIPLLPGKSTSAIIQKIIDTYNTIEISLDNEDRTSNTIFLDRDGVINEEVEYLHEPEKFTFIPHVLEGVKKMQDLGFKIVVITTQAGIGLGYFTKEDFFKVNKKMLSEFRKNGITLSKIYFCPHTISDNCSCRKPKTGLIERAQKDLDIDLKNSWFIGDKTSDITAGFTVGCHTILVKTGYKGEDSEYDVKPEFIAKDLRDAARYIEEKMNI